MEQINLEGIFDDVSAVSLEKEEITVKVMKSMIITETPPNDLPPRLFVKAGSEIQRYANLSCLPLEVSRIVSATQNGNIKELKTFADNLVKRLDEVSSETS